MHPATANAPADVLAGQDRLPAAAAGLPGGTRGITLCPSRGTVSRAEPDRAGALHRQPGTTGAEMLEMRAAHPPADRHPLPAVLESPHARATASPSAGSRTPPPRHSPGHRNRIERLAAPGRPAHSHDEHTITRASTKRSGRPAQGRCPYWRTTAFSTSVALFLSRRIASNSPAGIWVTRVHGFRSRRPLTLVSR